jgi:hypothetical protein
MPAPPPPHTMRQVLRQLLRTFGPRLTSGAPRYWRGARACVAHFGMQLSMTARPSCSPLPATKMVGRWEYESNCVVLASVIRGVMRVGSRAVTWHVEGRVLIAPRSQALRTFAEERASVRVRASSGYITGLLISAAVSVSLSVAPARPSGSAASAGCGWTDPAGGPGQRAISFPRPPSARRSANVSWALTG